MAAPDLSYRARFDLQGWYLIRQIARRHASLRQPRPRVIDLGCGRGRDVIYLARRGFRALGIDVDADALRVGERRAARYSIPARFVRDDLRWYQWRGQVDVVYSNCALNHLPAGERRDRFEELKAGTVVGGLHAVNAFVDRPALPRPPDAEAGETPFRSGELARYYRDWDRLESRPVIFPCRAGGRTHRHALELLIARKPSTDGPGGNPRGR